MKTEGSDQSSDQTPLMKQYFELKASVPDALLLFRMGDFYELFGEDAITASRILEITLTSRDKNKPNPMPMAGVPHHSIQSYIQRLLKAGRKVAIGEQMEDPSKVSGKAIVRREIVRVFTPGVQFDLEGSEANYLAAVFAEQGGDRFVMGCLDASTGEALVSEPIELEAIIQEIQSRPVRHLIYSALPSSDIWKALQGIGSSGVLVESLPSNYLSEKQAEELLKRHYDVASLNAFLSGATEKIALGSLVTYTLRTQQKHRLAHLRPPAPLRKPRSLVLGPRTPQHLDLLPTSDGSGSPNLFQLINRTKSALGARQLRRCLLAPLRETGEISSRQSAVREISGCGFSYGSGSGYGAGQVGKMAAALAEIYDLERLMGRINAGLANPRDTLAVGKSLRTLPGIVSDLSGFQSDPLSRLRDRLARAADILGPMGETIIKDQTSDAPFVSRDGGIFNSGVDQELDRLISLSTDAERWLIELEARERKDTGISTLKVRYNRVFGYYIEITQANLKNVPPHYQRKQTMVGAERFFTEELKKFEEDVLSASTRQKALEQELFDALVARIAEKTPEIMEAASDLADLDVLIALAGLAGEAGWCFPVIDDSLDLDIRGGRHPLVDRESAGKFVPNDVVLGGPDCRVLTITGPNMGGKSTVMRQTALIVLLGQMGAPVPAECARWGAVSALYTRIGAHDAIAKGQSTFMVEMSELAHIVHYADERSLIILDEIGRGTSTYDGISVAWSTLEWICGKLRARTLFATHYHELTGLEGKLPLLANAHMAVAGGNQSPGTLRFLYKLRKGPSSESFGIHVAQIAGLPAGIVERAWQVLGDLEAHAASGEHVVPSSGPEAGCDEMMMSADPAVAPCSGSGQMGLFDFPGAEEPPPEGMIRPAPLAPAQIDSRTQLDSHPILSRLEASEIDSMTPLEALCFLAELKKEMRQGQTPDAQNRQNM